MAFGIAKDAQGQHRITQQELVDITKQLQTKRGAGTNFFSLTQITKESTNKIPGFNPFVLTGLKNGKSYIGKVSQVNGMYGHNYEEEVNRQREREGGVADFVAKQTKYEPVEGTNAFVMLDGLMYLRYKPRSVARSFKPVLLKNTGNDTSFEILDKQQAQQYIKRVDPGTYQGLEKGAEIRKVSLASIAAININGKDYVITDLDPMRKAMWQTSGAPMPEENPEPNQQEMAQ
jgi:hypothetical protein